MDDTDAPVAVVDEENRLAGVVVRGALIAGLTTTRTPPTRATKTPTGRGPAIGSRRPSGGEE